MNIIYIKIEFLKVNFNFLNISTWSANDPLTVLSAR